MTDLLTRAARRTCEADPRLGTAPAPRLLLAMRDGRIIDSVAVDEVPDWARPVVMAAVEL